MGSKLAVLLYRLAVAYGALVVLTVLVNLFFVPSHSDIETPGTYAGCYQTDALLLYVACADFRGAGVTAQFLNLPYRLLQSPFGVVWSPLRGPAEALLLWGPILFLLICWVRRRRCR